MTATERRVLEERQAELKDRLHDQREAVTLLNPEVGGAVFTRGECRVLATALAVAETARLAVGLEWSTEHSATSEQLRQKACAGAAR